MRYYILQDNDYHDIITDCVRWGNSHDKFSTHNYKVLLTSDEKITRQTNPELFL